jgi:hypothetical protein
VLADADGVPAKQRTEAGSAPRLRLLKGYGPTLPTAQVPLSTGMPAATCERRRSAVRSVVRRRGRDGVMQNAGYRRVRMFRVGCASEAFNRPSP